MGWGAARNAGLRRARGRVVVIVDGSSEASGPWAGPILEALADPSVGVAGPFGLVTDDLRSFHEAPGPDVDAVEGYLMAVRRDLLLEGVRFDEKFRFYRMADVELSFQIKARGLRAVVVPLPDRPPRAPGLVLGDTRGTRPSVQAQLLPVPRPVAGPARPDRGRPVR